MIKASVCVLFAASLAAPAGAAATADSSTRYFRLDRGVAAATAGPLPDRFDTPGAQRWRTPMDGGHSSAILCRSGLVFTTFQEENKALATVALDPATGQLRWRRVAQASRLEPYHARTGNPAASTPACDGERLFVFFGSLGLICYDLEGRTLWEHPMGPFQDEFGAASSPIIVDDKVVLNEDHDRDSFLLALDRATGRTLWKVPRPDAVRSYSTPAVWTHNGRKELLVAGALELAAYDPANGQKLWWANGLARIVIPVPTPDGDMVYMASWTPGGDFGQRLELNSWADALGKWDKNGDGKLARAEIPEREVLERFYRMDLDQSGDLDQSEWERHAAVFKRAQNALLAIQPSGVGELSESAVVWKHRRGVPYVATPLADRGLVWMVKDGGIVTKLEGRTGRLLQEERLAGVGGYYASPVTGDGKVYFASEQGTVTILANQPEWRIISAHDFRERIYATPLIERDRIYVRTEKALYCFASTRTSSP
jgi:outer membrane protein assembly factor BamB